MTRLQKCHFVIKHTKKLIMIKLIIQFDNYRMTSKSLNRYSRKLTQILRHTAISQYGLFVDDDGFVELSEILNLKEFQGCSVDMVQDIVKTDDKTRMSLELRDVYWISANQGHSGEVAECLDPTKYLTALIEPIVPCLHGTYQKYKTAIQNEGLKIMGRDYIHCANGLPNQVKSGMRRDCNLLVIIDMVKAMSDGIKFYRSKNGVILTSGINGVLDAKYFTFKSI